jgi:hypothetical protein
MEFGFALGFGLYLRSWRTYGGGAFIGGERWSNRSLRGTPFWTRSEWTRCFWVGRRMFVLSRNCV